MASLVESGMRNLPGGDADSVGFFQMRVGIWNTGDYAGYPERPELQLDWFLDHAKAVKAQRVAGGLPIDPEHYGEWIADIERPAAEYRGRYQLRLDEAQRLLRRAFPEGEGLEDVADAGGHGSGSHPGERAREALAHARKMLGTPYQWGGESPQTGFDCSGLVQWAYARAGIEIPRVTDQQILAAGAQKVGRKHLLPGDLVFFRDASGYVHHVGMSLGGDRFIEAPRTGLNVRISSLNDPYYAQQFTGGRRFDAPLPEARTLASCARFSSTTERNAVQPCSDRPIGVLPGALSHAGGRGGVKGSRFSDITEFGRAVHAEMDALTTAARLGHRVDGCTLVTTTYPCHNCARHLIAAGIRRLVFVHPYAKSLARELHRDSIVIEPESRGGRSDRMVFEQFVGVAPRSYPQYFDFGQTSRKDDRGAAMQANDPTSARPRVLQDAGTFAFGGPALPAMRIGQLEQQAVEQFTSQISTIDGLELPVPTQERTNHDQFPPRCRQGGSPVGETGLDAEEIEERSQKEIEAALTASSTPGHWRPAEVENPVSAARLRLSLAWKLLDCAARGGLSAGDRLWRPHRQA